jgi:hypothetical protein
MHDVLGRPEPQTSPFPLSTSLTFTTYPTYPQLDVNMGAPVTIDTSLPISTLLREGTKVAHEKAEKSEGAAWLLRGELDREEYVRFLMMLWHVYE